MTIPVVLIICAVLTSIAILISPINKDRPNQTVAVILELIVLAVLLGAFVVMLPGIQPKPEKISVEGKKLILEMQKDTDAWDLAIQLGYGKTDEQ